ncbi:TetR/AcrR family transcriptional regulator [Stackebrandtia nassauensis]|uniref:Transcriptional regulator, TetR family n=1 Tax=Stackebrandtia nassauensis (strain DSM 44728 / CIP 108903 / NRRL B-16338 / NBRC 102104 / LLR-40K-21) TaxID=446470 RepID=D3PZQ3_STANL|nr:TetR/AcrR family transcriptional regulator [Stackebrandtia nassauensis]ADD43590.1 transcriptional regulator, TetR family [Stackebrandtia nassauensis DSM 44728]
MPKPTASTDRRQQLVEAAFDEIAANGFEGLRTRAVARAVGIDHSTVHHHFATKADLIAAVVDHAIAPFRTGKPLTGSPAEQLRDHLNLLVRLMRERPRLFIVLRELDLRATRDDNIRAILAERDNRWRDTTTTLFRQPGWHSDTDPEAAAELVIAAVKGASFAPDPDRAAAAIDELLRLLTPREERP